MKNTWWCNADSLWGSSSFKQLFYNNNQYVMYVPGQHTLDEDASKLHNILKLKNGIFHMKS